MTNNSSCQTGKHELYDSEYTTNDKGELVFVCQSCYAEIPSERVGDLVV